MVRFARLIHRRVRALAGFGGNLSLTWLPPRVIATAPLFPLLASQSAP
jgi:hypothetical protein